MVRWAVVAVALGASGRISFDAPASLGGGGPDGNAGARCASVAPTCGPQHDQSCCASAAVPGGSFFRSYDIGSDNAFSDMSWPATVSGFTLDTYEVTVARFRAFVDSGAGTQQQPPAVGAGAGYAAGTGWRADLDAGLPANTAALRAQIDCPNGMWEPTPGAFDVRPMDCVTWPVAFAFCIWDGGRLPTEAEWNYAAVGGDEQRKWPWSTSPNVQITPTDASYVVNGDCTGDGLPGCSDEDFAIPGSFPDGNGRWGHADMVGNVWEWVYDRFDPYDVPCDDCAPVGTLSDFREFHGGGAGNTEDIERAAYRNQSPTDYVFYDIGLRCAR
ncbi:MAG TPA: formylglycine-generating enzyme family protein [Kofleriaceae bacterium]|jgi:formylglycine-generating enzyme required for sulfatase activity